MTDYYLQLCPQNSHRRRQDQGRKYETMSLISFSSLIIVISSVELPYLSTATNWQLHANDKEMCLLFLKWVFLPSQSEKT